MTPAVLALGLGLGAMGLCALCLSLARHHGAVFAAPLGPRRILILRALGWGLIVVSLAASVAFEGWGFGLVQWIGTLTGAAFVLVVALSYRPRALPWIAGLAAGLSAGAAALIPLSP